VIEGLRIYNLTKLTSYMGRIAGTTQPGNIRTGTRAWESRWYSAPTYYYSNMYANQLFDIDEFYVRFGLKIAVRSSAGDLTNIFEIFKSSIPGVGTDVVFRLRPIDDNNINIEYLYNGTDWYQIGQKYCYTTQYYCWEIHWKNGTGNGEIEVLVDGVREAYVSGIDNETGNPVEPFWFMWGGKGVTNNVYHYFYLDDIAINDTGGDNNNSWPGLGGIISAVPNGEGNREELSRAYPGGETRDANWQVVDEIPTADTDYVFNMANAEKDLYTSGSPSVTEGIVNSVAFHIVARNAASGNAVVYPHFFTSGSGGLEASSGSPITVTTQGFLGYVQNLDKNPCTGEDWDIHDFPGLQFGPKIG
jgi:hypothetical protein